MKTEGEWQYERQQLYELMKANPEWSLRACAYELAHDPKWVRKWAKRFAGHPQTTPALFASQSRRPRQPARQMATTLKDRLGELRESLSERFHRPAGAKTIAYFLQSECQGKLPSASSIYKVLHERCYVRPRAKSSHTPLVLPAPMEEWELDFGEIYLGAIEGNLEFFMVVDRGTSRVIYVEGTTNYRAVSTIEALMRLFTLHGLPKRLRFDRDPRLWGSWTRDSYPSPFLRLLHALGVEPIVCPPRRPDKKPCVERAIGTLKQEWLARHAPTTLADAIDLLEPFITYHNSERPHQGAACGNRIPDEVFPHLPVLPTLPKRVRPDAWLIAQQGRVYRRRVNANGSIQVDKHHYYIGYALAGRRITLHLDAQRTVFDVHLDGALLQTLPIKGLHPGDYDLWHYVDMVKAEARTIEVFRYFHWQQTGDAA